MNKNVRRIMSGVFVYWGHEDMFVEYGRLCSYVSFRGKFLGALCIQKKKKVRAMKIMLVI